MWGTPEILLGSGVTAIIFDEAVIASVDVRGGGPGTRETALLDPAHTVESIDAIVLSGGSAFGLDAASGVQAWLREQGRGFRCARRAFRSCRAQSFSTCWPAVARIGGAIRPIASSVTKRPGRQAMTLPWAAPALVSAPRPSI